jgi:hypothetical protein
MKASGLFGAAYEAKAKNILSERFLLSPFSVLNTREGWWQNRKRQWINIGIKSEVGRGYTEEGTAYGTSLGKPGELMRKYKDASPGGSPRPAMNQKGHVKGQPITRGDGRGRPIKSAFPAMKGHGQGFGKDTPIVRGGAHSNSLVKKGLTFGINDLDEYRNKNAGHVPADEEVIGGTSIFDPVLCELAYRWFCPVGGSVLDPFSGGSVRGIVAGELGLHYTGIDLSATQIAANKKQAVDIGTVPEPVWLNGDSATELLTLRVGEGPQEPENQFDFIFSCPPYGDLERYSTDPRDISSMSADDFAGAYIDIIEKACALLKPNRFACFVVGDYRDKDGFYNDLPGKTIYGFERAGLRLYNYAILLNAIGSLPLRINAQFAGSRKLGKCHQDVLIFAKGNPKDFVKTWPTMEIK